MSGAREDGGQTRRLKGKWDGMGCTEEEVAAVVDKAMVLSFSCVLCSTVHLRNEGKDNKESEWNDCYSTGT